MIESVGKRESPFYMVYFCHFFPCVDFLKLLQQERTVDLPMHGLGLSLMEVLGCRSEEGACSFLPSAAAMLFHGLPGGEMHGVIDEMDRRGKNDSAGISSAIDMGETETVGDTYLCPLQICTAADLLSENGYEKSALDPARLYFSILAAQLIPHIYATVNNVVQENWEFHIRQ